jgi:hypothetical protein
MPTKRTTQEAKDYINETIKFWEEEGRESKIVSLANFAEKWRYNKGGPKSKIIGFHKEIKSLQELILRHNKLEPTNFEGPLHKALVDAQVKYEELVKIHGLPKGLVVGKGVTITRLPTKTDNHQK